MIVLFLTILFVFFLFNEQIFENTEVCFFYYYYYNNGKVLTVSDTGSQISVRLSFMLQNDHRKPTFQKRLLINRSVFVSLWR